MISVPYVFQVSIKALVKAPLGCLAELTVSAEVWLSAQPLKNITEPLFVFWYFSSWVIINCPDVGALILYLKSKPEPLWQESKTAKHLVSVGNLFTKIYFI